MYRNRWPPSHFLHFDFEEMRVRIQHANRLELLKSWYSRWWNKPLFSIFDWHLNNLYQQLFVPKFQYVAFSTILKLRIETRYLTIITRELDLITGFILVVCVIVSICVICIVLLCNVSSVFSLPHHFVLILWLVLNGIVSFCYECCVSMLISTCKLWVRTHNNGTACVCIIT